MDDRTAQIEELLFHLNLLWALQTGLPADLKTETMIRDRMLAAIYLTESGEAGKPDIRRQRLERVVRAALLQVKNQIELEVVDE